MTIPRLVATDLDGTLLGSDGAVSARTRAVLEAIDQLGVPVVFTTGRPLRWMETLWQDVGGHGLAIVSNGGIVFDVANQRVREHWPIPSDTLLGVAETVRDQIPGTTFAVEAITGFSHEPHFMPRMPVNRAGGVPIGPLTQIVTDDVVKLLMRHEEMAPEPFWHAVDKLVGDVVTTTWSSEGALVEVSCSGVTKATTLASLSDELGVAQEDVVAFGDMPNDLPLLTWAGRGIAMRNAHPTVREVADQVTLTNDEDGVAVALSEMFGLDA